MEGNAEVRVDYKTFRGYLCSIRYLNNDREYLLEVITSSKRKCLSLKDEYSIFMTHEELESKGFEEKFN